MPRRLIIILGLVWLVSSCQGATHKIEGSLVLIDGTLDQNCLPGGGYSDIQPLVTQVTVSDQTGKVIGLGKLNSGTFSEPSLDVTRVGGPLWQKSCRFPFTIEHVPEVEFYGIEVSHRGTIRKSLAEMKNDSWKVGLTLGRNSPL